MKRVLLTAIAILLSFAAAPARGEDPPGPPRERQQAETGKASYVNASFEAEEALNRARRRAEAGRWAAAAEAYQDIGQRFGGYVIAADDRRFINVRTYVNNVIARWPPPGLAAYRAAFGAPAEAALAAARRQPTLVSFLSVADSYFATSAGAAALDAASELAFERGDFGAARRWYADLLSDHPDRQRLGVLWRAKEAVCAAWAGDPSGLVALIEELSPDRPGPPVDWGGREQALRDFLRAVSTEIDTGATVAAPAGEPGMFGGGPDRRGFYESAVAPEAQLWRAPVFARAGVAGSDEGGDSQIARRDAALRALQSGRLLASVPVAAEHLVYLHDYQTVLAIDPDRPEKPLWRYDLSPVPRERVEEIADDNTPPLFTSLLAGGRLYVHLDCQPPGTVDGRSGTASSLVCLDAATGRVIWRNDLAGFASDFEEARLDGAPLLHQGKLFAAARRRKQFGFEACFLVCFKADDGSLLWSAHVGEAATGRYGYHRPTQTHPAAAGGLVFVHTNLGTVAAVSAMTGRPRWIYRYDSKYAGDTDDFWSSRMGQPTHAWQYQPTILWREAVVCAPLDMEHILVLNQADGRERFRIPLEQLHNPETILGIHGDRLFAVGSQIVCYDLAERRIAWQRPLAEGQLFGRGAVTTGGAVIPTDRGLLRYPPGGGPASVFHWPLDQAGNLLALPDQIIVASAHALYGLVDKQEAFRRLARRMKAAPSDPIAALALAKLAFNTGEYERGRAAVEEAVRRLGGFARLEDDRLRRRLFDDLMRFSELLLARLEERPRGLKPAAPRSVEIAVELLGMAGRCAPDHASQVRYRLQLARVLTAVRDFAGAVQVCQQILSDRSLRRLWIEARPRWLPPGRPAKALETEHEAPQRHAGALARDWIERLIADHGPAVYAAMERRARDRLKVAEARGDAEAVLNVTDTFPNSRAAATALVAHARLMCKQSNWNAARRSYRRALSRLSGKDRERLLPELVTSLISGGRPAEAARWLERAVREHPDAQLPASRAVPGPAIAELPSHPAIAWPIRQSLRRLYPDRVAVLEPAFAGLPDTRWDALLTFSAGQIEARSAATGRGGWPQPVPCPTQPVYLGATPGGPVFATPYRIFALTGTSGRLSWQVGEEPPDDPGADPESIPSWTHHFLTARRLYSASDRGELVCIDVRDGGIQWRHNTESGTDNLLVAGDRHVATALWRGRRTTITVLDAETGRAMQRVEMDDPLPVQMLAMDSDSTLLAVLGRSIHAIDPDSGEIRWRADTPDHFVLSTLRVDVDGVFVSGDGRRITKYDLHDGRTAWTTPPIGRLARGGLWMEVLHGVLYAASADALMAFDATDGRLLWSAEDPPGLALQAPRLVADSLVTVSPEKKKSAPPHGAAGQAAQPTRYRIRRFALIDGKEKPVSDTGPLLTDPLASFGGLFVRDQALIVLDGDRLIGYVE